MTAEPDEPSSTIEAVRQLYRRIAALPGLAPGPHTDAAFTDLVRFGHHADSHGYRAPGAGRPGGPSPGSASAAAVLRGRDLDHVDFDGYDVVWLAALVVLDGRHKRQVLSHLFEHLRPGALLLARSAHSLRTLLYPPLPVDDLGGFPPLVVLHPYTDIVNSVVIAQKPERG